MKNIYTYLGVYLLLIFTFIACEKDEPINAGLIIEPVIVEKLSASFVQAGDELTLFGDHLVQKDLRTEVFISGRPSEILRSSADSIMIRVPEKVKTGIITVTLSKGAQFSSVSGPSIEVKPTPLIKSVWPLVAYGGDTIVLSAENFSDVDMDNAIYIGTQKVAIISRKGKDTILIKLPADATSGELSWQTYNGPILKTNIFFPVRQTNYAVVNVSQWFSTDPGFTYMDTLVRGFAELAENYHRHKPIFDTALQYINSVDRTYTIFLPDDTRYQQENVSLPDFVDRIRNMPYRLNNMLANAIVPGQNIHLSNMQDGDMYKTAYTKKLAFYDYPIEEDEYNYIKVVIEDGVKYIQVWGPYDQFLDKVKIIREHQVGNATLIEIDREAGVITY